MKKQTVQLWTRSFTLVTIATALGAAGGIAGGFALSFLVFDETGSTLASALVVAIQLIPMVLLPLVVAPMMDRLPRKPFLVWGDLLNGLCYAGAGLFLLHSAFSYTAYLAFSLLVSCLAAFDELAYNSFYPVAPALIEELGVDGFRSCDNTTMWYNGPYVVEEYIQGNTKSYIPNPNYYDAANVSRFERFTVTMISDGSISLQLYQSRELDEVDLGESNITTIQSDPSNEYNQQLCEKRAKKFSYCFIFNYDKKNTDGTPDENWNKAIANKAFRQCFSKGMVLNKFFARYNPINQIGRAHV